MKHLTNMEINRYYSHGMKEDEERELLGHISVCEYCAGRFANAFLMQEMLTPPVALRSDVLQKVSERKTSARRFTSYREWYLYCVRVIVAMGMAIMMLFLGNVGTEKQNMTQEQKQIESDVSEQIGEHVEKFGDVMRGWSEWIGQGLRGEG